MTTLQQAKEYLRIDFEDEDAFLSSLLMSSEKYIVNATRSDVDRNDPLFETAQRMLVAHWYENRNTVIVGSTSKVLEFALESLLFQLSYSESVQLGDVEIVDSGEF